MTMSLDEFRTSVRVLPEPEARAIRGRFVDAFVDPAAGAGPMWSGLRHRQRVSLARLWATVAASEVVTVMWDPPCEEGRRRLADRAFGPSDVIECRVADLEQGVEWLPDDLYLFDGSLTWSAIFTHESDVDGGIQLLARGSTTA